MSPRTPLSDQEQQQMRSEIFQNGHSEHHPELLKKLQLTTNAINNTQENQQDQHQEQPEDGLPSAQYHQGYDLKRHKERRPVIVVWRNVLLMSALHLGAFLGLRLVFTSAQYKTTLLAILLYRLGGLGITAGAHRLWSHRSYKAKWPLRVVLCLFQTLAFQNSIYEWSRDHRTHHKFSETDADPHDATRGFFFSHVGWLLSRKHPQVVAKGKTIDVSDLSADPIVRFQHRHYLLFVALIAFVVPTLLPVYLWGETVYNGFYICALLRYVTLLHATWLVNSAAHMWGRHPYDKTIHPAENRAVSLFALGEGFHNYHHTFPWDYAASELGYDLNTTKLFIDAMSTLGLAYERKLVKADMIRQRKQRTGDVHELGPYGPND